jgi:hypothetical protein
VARLNSPNDLRGTSVEPLFAFNAKKARAILVSALPVSSLSTLCFAPATESSSMNLSGNDVHGQVQVAQESLNQVLMFPKERPGDRTIIQVGEKPHEIELSGDGRTNGAKRSGSR